jgi:hypothetical protein
MRDSRPLLIALIFFFAACGGSQSSGASGPSPSVAPTTTATVTLTDAGCRYYGPTHVPAGQFIAHLANQTNNTFFLGLGRIEQGHTYQDFVEWTDRDRDREIHGLASLGPPDWLPGISHVQAEPGHAVDLMASVGKGIYAFGCGRLDLTETQPKELGVWAAGPFEVS